jgi:hypothetical protein
MSAGQVPTRGFGLKAQPAAGKGNCRARRDIAGISTGWTAPFRGVVRLATAVSTVLRPPRTREFLPSLWPLRGVADGSPSVAGAATGTSRRPCTSGWSSRASSGSTTWVPMPEAGCKQWTSRVHHALACRIDYVERQSLEERTGTHPIRRSEYNDLPLGAASRLVPSVPVHIQ